MTQHTSVMITPFWDTYAQQQSVLRIQEISGNRSTYTAWITLTEPFQKNKKKQFFDDPESGKLRILL